jgi:hypothetical protein
MAWGTSKERFAAELNEFLVRSTLSTRRVTEIGRRRGIGYSTLQSWRSGEHLPRAPDDNSGLVAFLREVEGRPGDADRLLTLAKKAWREALQAKRGRSAQFVGREVQRRVLASHLRAIDGVVVIWGSGGVGKTALAREVVGAFDGRRLAVDLRGSSDAPLSARRAMAELLDPGLSGTMETLLAAYQGLVSDERTVVLLDDAADVQQVQPLLVAHCRTVITSREPLSEIEEQYGALRLHLGPLHPMESQELLARVVTGPAAELAELAEMCRHHPLALRVAAQQAADSGLRRCLTAMYGRDDPNFVELAYRDLPAGPVLPDQRDTRGGHHG